MPWFLSLKSSKAILNKVLKKLQIRKHSLKICQYPQTFLQTPKISKNMLPNPPQLGTPTSGTKNSKKESNRDLARLFRAQLLKLPMIRVLNNLDSMMKIQRILGAIFNHSMMKATFQSSQQTQKSGTYKGKSILWTKDAQNRLPSFQFNQAPNIAYL